MVQISTLHSNSYNGRLLLIFFYPGWEHSNKLGVIQLARWHSPKPFLSATCMVQLNLNSSFQQLWTPFWMLLRADPIRNRPVKVPIVLQEIQWTIRVIGNDFSGNWTASNPPPPRNTNNFGPYPFLITTCSDLYTPPTALHNT